MIEIRNRDEIECRFIDRLSARYAVLGVLALSVLSLGTPLVRSAAAAQAPKETTVSRTPEQAAVAARSMARMKKMIAGDTKAVYGFLPPATRKSMSYKQFMDSHRLWVKVKHVKLMKVRCSSATNCHVDMQWTFLDDPGPKGVNVGEVTAVFGERWIKVDGQWWYYSQ